jgi:hypothetical protein
MQVGRFPQGFFADFGHQAAWVLRGNSVVS